MLTAFTYIYSCGQKSACSVSELKCDAVLSKSSGGVTTSQGVHVKFSNILLTPVTSTAYLFVAEQPFEGGGGIKNHFP